MLKKHIPLVLILFVSIVGLSAPISDAQALIEGENDLAAPASSGGSWTITGYMNEAREHHSAVLLNDGRVLVAGGRNSSHVSTSSSELYDPATGGWMRTGSLAEAHFRHTLTVLSDGRVLAVGGVNHSNTPLGSAEIYDPVDGTWSATSSLNAARYLHTATLLPDGKVLVVGGNGPNDITLTSAELYDPGTGSWTIINPLANARFLHTATLLNDGTVLVTGGYNPGSIPPYTHASTELYDPDSDTWTMAGSLDHPRVWHTATLLEDGKVLVSGGYDGDLVYPAHGELYDPNSGSWSNTGILSAPRESHTATLLSDGNVLIAGGSSDFTPNFTFSEADVYSADSGLFTPISAMPVDRAFHTATLLSDGSVLVAGGYNDNQGVLAGTVLYGSSRLKTVSNCDAFAAPGGLKDALVGGGDISFACDGTIIVPEIDIEYDTLLDADGHDVTLTGNQQNRIFIVRPSVELAVIGLNMEDGEPSSTVQGDNPISDGGGLINLGGHISLNDCTFANFWASYGAIIYNHKGTITINNCVLKDSWSLVGPALFVEEGTAYIYGSTVENNWSENGAVVNWYGAVEILRSTISNNISAPYSSGGGVYNYGAMTIVNSTISGNYMIDEGWWEDPRAAVNNRGHMAVTNSTISNNYPVGGYGIQNGSQYPTPHVPTLVLSNSIVVNNGGGEDCFIIEGQIDGENNLIDTSCGSAENLGPVTGFDLALADNGGLTLTHAIIEGSNALDAADSAFCPGTDQRGIRRPQGPGCDIGAFEREYVPTPDERIQSLIEDVRDLVESGVLENGNGLIAILENTIASLEKGNTTAACGQLGAFINHVEGSIRNGKLTVADGQPLIGGAQGVRNDIGC